MRSLRLLAGIVHLVILFENTRAEKILYELEVNPQNCKPAIPRSTSPVSVNFKGEDTTTSGSYKTTGYMPLTKIHEGPFETKTYVFYAEDVGVLTLMQVKLTDDGQLGNWCLGTSKLTIAKHGKIVYFDGGTVQPKNVTDLEVAFAKDYTGSPPPVPTSPPLSPSPSVVPIPLTPDPPAHTWASTSAREGLTAEEPLGPVAYILIVAALLLVVFGMITVGYYMLAERRGHRKRKDHGSGTDTGTDSTTNTALASSLFGKPVEQPVPPVEALSAPKDKSVSSETGELSQDEEKGDSNKGLSQTDLSMESMQEA